MARISLDTLTLRVTEYFRRNAGKYGLRAETLEVRYILNWGGFVNASFFIKDGLKSYHLKLADESYVQMGLMRWREYHKLLSGRYRAPRMYDWVKIPRTPFEGALFSYIPGKHADLAAQPEIMRGVLDLLPRLHSESVLREGLDEGESLTCADYFLDLYITRFDEDLMVVANDLPPFITLNSLTWMMGETRELEGIVRDLPAFQAPANAPTHGDLGQNNILVTPEGLWYIIDWDDLALGDPVIDYSILLGSLWRSGAYSQSEMDRRLPTQPNDPGFRERFRVYLRALVLDQVIDSLADWCESRFAPVHQDEVRLEKEKIHREALALYQKHWS